MAYHFFLKLVLGPQLPRLDPKVNQAIDVLLAAFEKDVIANNLVGGRQELRLLTFTAIVHATLVGGMFYVAVEYDRVVGTACWFPPGSDLFADEKQGAEGAELFKTLEKTDPSLFAWWMNTLLPTSVAISNKCLGENFQLDNWNLYSLSVAPSHQGRGIVKKLLKIGEDQAAEQHLSVCFDSDVAKNIALYNHLGYRTVGSGFVEGPPNLPGYTSYVLLKVPVLDA